MGIDNLISRQIDAIALIQEELNDSRIKESASQFGATACGERMGAQMGVMGVGGYSSLGDEKAIQELKEYIDSAKSVLIPSSLSTPRVSRIDALVFSVELLEKLVSVKVALSEMQRTDGRIKSRYRESEE